MDNKKAVTLFVAIFLVMSLFTVGSITSTEKSEEKMSEADYINRRFDFSEPRLVKNGGKFEFEYEEGHPLIKDGAPPLPVFTSEIIIPYQKKVTDVDVEFEGKELLARDISLEKTKVKVLCEDLGEDKIDESFSESEYPKNKVDHDIFKIRGYQVMSIRLIPFEYYPERGNVWNFDSAEVNIELKDSEKNSDLYRGLPRDRKMINDMVESPDDVVLSSYPDAEPSNTLQTTEYLMITTSALESSFQTLIDHKESRGVSTSVELVSDIESNYNGVDTQEKIRNCIKDYYNNEGTTFVALAGDTTDESGNDIVPHRGLYADSSSGGGCEDEVPSDYYFAGLDGDWNANGNDVYGEWADEPDWGMEVWVGRIPAQDTTEADTLIDKIITWENGDRTKQQYSICQDDSGNLGDFKNNKEQDTSYSDAVHNIIPSDWSINTDYESETGGNSVQMYHDGISGSSSGGTPPMFVNHAGHGSPTGYEIGGTYYTESEVSSLSNDWYPIQASIACTSGTFDGRDNNQGSYTSDRDCLAEEFLKHPNGGLVATFMNTRYGLGTQDGATGLSGAIDTRLYHGVFTEEYNNLGHAAQWARMSYIQEQGEDEFARWSTQAMNLLGDPEMPVLNDVTSDGVISLDRDKYAGEDVVEATVMDADLEGTSSIDIDIMSDTETTPETVTLSEISTGSSEFQGSIEISETDQDGVLHVSHGDIITAEYVDADTGDGSGETKEATASVDAEPPSVISSDPSDGETEVSIDLDNIYVNFSEEIDSSTFNSSTVSLSPSVEHTIEQGSDASKYMLPVKGKGGGNDAEGSTGASVYGDYKDAQGFIPSDSDDITEVELYMLKEGSPPGDCVVEIIDSPPDGNALGTASISPSEIGTSASWVTADFSSPVSVSAGTSYGIRVQQEGGQGDESNRYRVMISGDQYADGHFHQYDGSQWNEFADYDLSFRYSMGSPLQEDTWYTGTVGSQVADKAGNTLGSSYDFEFYTGTENQSFDITLSSSDNGWNFVSSKLMPTTTDLVSILEDSSNGISGSYEKVMYYDAETDDWMSYKVGREDHFNDLDTWDRTMGIWIQMNTDDTLTVAGSEPGTTTISLQPGWNMIGYPSNSDETASSILPQEVTKIGVFDRNEEYNIKYETDLSQVIMTPGKGYFVYNDGSDPVDFTISY